MISMGPGHEIKQFLLITHLVFQIQDLMVVVYVIKLFRGNLDFPKIKKLTFCYFWQNFTLKQFIDFKMC